MRLALGLEYDGSRFHGWQSQPDGATVQDVLESALAKVACAPIRVSCAGRTDAGVHAIEQVVHFDTDAKRLDSAWVRGVNRYLPCSVAVRWAKPVSDEFHARFSARGRRYRYALLNRSERPGLMAQRVGWFHRQLDIELMSTAAACLLGEHDFSAFRAAECQAKSPIKTLRRAALARHGDMILFDFEASAFLHHMVRNLVGALVYVGKGRYPPSWLADVLAGRDRAQAAPTFEASGLYFAGVDYDPVWRLNTGVVSAASVLL